MNNHHIGILPGISQPRVLRLQIDDHYCLFVYGVSLMFNVPPPPDFQPKFNILYVGIPQLEKKI